MRLSVVYSLLTCALFILSLTGCSRDPNVRKQKYLESGDHYFSQGKYGEAAIQYRNAIKQDSKFVQAHYQLSQAYLRLRDGRDAYDELNRTITLDPDNYRAHIDLANLLSPRETPRASKRPRLTSTFSSKSNRTAPRLTKPGPTTTRR